jgi:hypothetical protein
MKIKVITFQDKIVRKEVKKNGLSRVPLSYRPKKGTGLLSNVDFPFAYSWIREEMKRRNRNYTHENLPYWGSYLPKELDTKENFEYLKEIFCSPGRELIKLEVPLSECFLTSFDLFDTYVLRKQFFGSEKEMESFNRDLYTEFLNKIPGNPDRIELAANFDILPINFKKRIIESLQKTILPFDDKILAEIVKSGDYVQVTFPEIRPEYILK